DGATVQLDQAPDKGETDAQAALRQHPGVIHLGEHVENAMKHLGRNADSAVRDRHLQTSVRIVRRQRAAQFDRPAGGGVFRGVVQQVGQNLGQAYRVG